jgi:hypothetical protein
MTDAMPRLVFRSLVRLLLLCCWIAGQAGAQSPPPNPASPASTNLPGAHVGDPNTVPVRLPALPGTKTAADTFRELLAMSPPERAQALADRSEHQRKYLQDRLREYESLPPEQREARLKQFELTCHMLGLMRLAPDKRATRLAAVPSDLRPLVDERLRQWDLLSPRVQQEALEYETTANYFLRVRSDPPSRAEGPGSATAPPPPGAGERNSRLAEHLSRFLELPAKEQQKTLESLSSPERQAIARTLRAFSQLPPEQRAICLNSFAKFGRMSAEQRDQFLQNAARWNAMSPQERETWRTLVEIVPPGQPTSRLPPLPPGDAVQGGPATASNRSVLPP